MSKVELAVARFNEGFSCSQAILSTYGTDFGLDEGLANRLSEGFSGGMGNMGLTCGAVTGALMVIGLKYGRTEAADKRSQVKTLKVIQEFVTRFQSRHGTLVCNDLLQVEEGTGLKRLFSTKRKRIATVCPNVVRDAAEIMEAIL